MLNNTADITECQNAGKKFTKAVDECVKPSKSLEASCTCFIDLKNDTLEKVKNCNISEKVKKVKEATQNCTTGNSSKMTRNFLFTAFLESNLDNKTFILF